MSRRADEKAQLRAARIEAEAEAEAETQAAANRRRLTLSAGIVLAAAAVAVIAIVIASHHGKPTDPNAATAPTSTVAQATDHRVEALLKGIPQHGEVLGRANAPVSVIEYGDLECSVCDAFALPRDIETSDGTPGSGVADEIIQRLVRPGRVNFVYRSLETETAHGATAGEWFPQQVAAYAAGLQDRAWNDIELFYNEQGEEGTDYVSAAYLEGIARQIPGLDLARWKRDLSSAALHRQVAAETRAGTEMDDAVPNSLGASTPTVFVEGPKGQQIVSLGVPAYAQVLAAVNAVR